MSPYRKERADVRLPTMIKFLASRRVGNLAGFLLCAGMLAFGYYLQFIVGLEPCPLCIVQRILLFAVGVAFLAAALHHPAGRLGARLYGGGVAFIGAISAPGAGAAGRAQQLPPGERPPRGPTAAHPLPALGPAVGRGSVFPGLGA